MAPLHFRAVGSTPVRVVADPAARATVTARTAVVPGTIRRCDLNPSFEARDARMAHLPPIVFTIDRINNLEISPQGRYGRQARFSARGHPGKHDVHEEPGLEPVVEDRLLDPIVEL